MQGSRQGNSQRSSANSLLLSNMLRPFREQSESELPFVPFVGGPRMFILLLYASVVVVTAVEYFISPRLWPGTWEIYNSYVFVVTGVFVFLGMVMLLSTERETSDEYTLPIPKHVLGTAGFVLLAASGLALVYWGKDIGAWAIPLSILLVYGFLMMLIGGRGFETKESMRLTLFGTGLVLMILVPVHEAFGVAEAPEGEFYFFTFLNLVLFISGMTLALVAVQALQTRDGFVGAWLLGAMAIFLIAFHEQLHIVASGTYSPYDRGLALIGISFSFLPLAMYFWRERVYFFLWRRLNSANSLIQDGKYDEALKQAEAAIRQCSRVGIDDRFALPWSLKADALYRMKDFPKAMVHYDTALRIDPKDSTSWSHLGNMYAMEGKHDEALKAFDQAIKVDPTNGPAWNNKGVVLQTMTRYEEAIVCFDKAIQFMEDPFDPHINLAKLFSKLGHTTDALKHYQAALALRPKSEIANEGVQREFHRGKCMDQINGWEQLGLDTSYLRNLLEEDPKNFVKKSKEFLKSIAELKTPLEVVPAKEHIDMASALQTVVKMTEGGGATVEQLEEWTGLARKDLVLPLALLVETDRVHFRTDGSNQLYVAKGKPPEKPPAPPPPPPKPVVVAPPPKEEPEEKPEPPAPKPVVVPVEKPVERPVERPVEAETPVQRPAVVERPVERPAESVPEKVFEAPRELPKPAPVAPPVEEPAKEPVKASPEPPAVPIEEQERIMIDDEDEVDENAIACPLCGLPVGPTVSSCPYCGAEFAEAGTEDVVVPDIKSLGKFEPKPSSEQRKRVVLAHKRRPEPKPVPKPVKKEAPKPKVAPKPEPKPVKVEKPLKRFEKKLVPKKEVKPEPKAAPKQEKKVDKRAEKKLLKAQKKAEKKEAKRDEGRLLKPVKKEPEKPAPKRAEKKPAEPVEDDKKSPPHREVIKVEPTAGILFFRRKKK